MSEFELSTLIMVVMLLAALGGYSYWQIMRAQRSQRPARKAKTKGQAGFYDKGHEETLIGEFESDIAPHSSSSVAAKMAQAPVASDIYVRSQMPPVVMPRDVASIKSIHTTEPAFSKTEKIEKTEDLSDVASHSSEPITQETEAASVVELESNVIDGAVDESTELSELNQPVAPTDSIASIDDVESSEPISTEPTESTEAMLNEEEKIAEDPQFFSQQDLTEQATLSVFEPLIRFSSWVDSTHPEPIYAIDGVLDLMVSQPKNAQDIERALYDLRLDTDLPLKLFGLRAGQVAAMHSDNPNAARQWLPLEMGALYSGLRLTLQLANAAEYADSQLIHDWFELAQRLAKRLAAHVSAWPDPAALANYALYLHDLSKRLGAPMVVQLCKPQGLWPAYEVHQQMTQWGLQLDENGQYVARHANGRILYRVLNDVNNPRAQEFFRDTLATMHVHTLSFCLDVSRVEVSYQAEQRLWHDMNQLAYALQANWCNSVGHDISSDALFTHAAEHIPAYIQQLATLGVPAGSITMKRLLQGSTV
ncbi:cell division protein ZipA C-terminal FtsZ-binding domain-containing protein [Hydromonas duriensis]|uniref:ZipA-like protein with FtsZ-binding domain n=1 Tax=Hydromonas duriensis TaxID=1527608 RepID=A0A4R6YBG8_9BURK|nr:cell division protein ZipA C-terminal FtsZ-binding domain-containing protein [Hydromonas duriensis]TDR33017.1 ZipA-like protein with FtsZ-binding domain [Hydromonas duriensis]